MAAPSTCVITAPVTGTTYEVGPGDSKTLTITGTTDASTAVELFDGVTSKGTGTSNGSGAFTFSNKVFAIGSHSLTVVAGTNPDTLTSAAVAITVTDILTGDALGGKSAQWYLNFLAGRSVSAGSVNTMLTARAAACAWAGVSVVDYTYAGALNVKAGITDRSLWVSPNKALNFIAYNTTNPDSCKPWLTNMQALRKIALAV